jgi:hypothetical protein
MMHTIAYKNSDKKILFVRLDNGTAGSISTPQEWLVNYCEANNLSVSDYTAVGTAYDKKMQIIIGNHVYNEATGQIEADPSYVPPPEPEPTPVTPAEPTE